MSDFANLTVGQEEGIGQITINRPDALNALNQATLEELREAIEEFRADQDVRALLLTGAGPKAFIAGADIKELMVLDPMEARDVSRLGQEIFGRVEAFPKPVIAAINGFCLGGGCELALACHIRIAAEDAKFGQPEVKLGLIPGYGGTQRLPRLIGKGRALEMILSGEMITAQEALTIGLVNRVVPGEELISTCRSLAAKITRNGPLAVQYCIEAVNAGLEMPLSEALSLEATFFGLASATSDMKEGTRAFVEKRKPVFEGK